MQPPITHIAGQSLQMLIDGSKERQRRLVSLSHGKEIVDTMKDDCSLSMNYLILEGF